MSRPTRSLRSLRVLCALTPFAMAVSIAWFVFSDDLGDRARAGGGSPTHVISDPKTATSETGVRAPATRRRVSARGSEIAASERPDADDDSTRAWVYRLCSPEFGWKVSSRAHEVLRQRSVRRVVPVLLSAIGRADTKSGRVRALDLIEAFGEAAAPWADDVASLLSDEQLIRAVKSVLRSVGDEGDSALVRAAGSAHARVRWGALVIMSLAPIVPPEFLRVAIQHFDDENAQVREAAFDVVWDKIASSELVLSALIAALDSSRATQLLAIDTLSTAGEQASPAAAALIDLLDAAAPEVRIAAASALGGIPSAASASLPSMRALLESDPGTYATVAMGIIRLSSEACLDGLSSHVPSVRAAFAQRAHWVDYYDPESVKPVVERLAELLGDDASVRREALAALRDIDGDRRPAAARLRQLAEDQRVPTRDRIRAAQLLADIPGAMDDAVFALAAVLGVGTGAERVGSIDALRGLGKAAAPAVTALRVHVVRGASDVRSSALRALAAIGPAAAAALPDIRRAVNSSSSQVRLNAALAVLAIDPSSRVAQELLDSSRYGDLTGVVVDGILRSPRPELAGFLASRVLESRSGRASKAMEGLRRMGKPGIAALVEAFGSARSSRSAVIDALGRIGEPARAALEEIGRRSALGRNLSTQVAMALEGLK